MRGRSCRRHAGKVNPNLETGAIECRGEELESSPTPRRRRSRSTRTSRSTRSCGSPTAISTSAARRCSERARRCATASSRRSREVLDDARLPRGRDAVPGPLDARGRARLPRAEPRPPRALLRAAAVAAALQAAADGRGLRALLPDRPLLPRRGPRAPTASPSSPSSTSRCRSSSEDDVIEHDRGGCSGAVFEVARASTSPRRRGRG